MKLFSSQRSRSIKAARVAAGSRLSGRLSESLKNSEILLRLLISAVFLAAITVLVVPWKPAFPYRLGENLTTGVMARVDFTARNDQLTDLKIFRIRNEVPQVFRNDPRQLIQLRDRLREHLFEVAAVPMLEQLSSEARTLFAFAPEDVMGIPEEEVERYRNFRELLGPVEMSEQRIDEIVGDFAQMIATVQKTGFLDAADLSRNELTLDQAIEVTGESIPEGLERVKVADVLLTETLKPNGRLGRQWKLYPAIEKVQPWIERWLISVNPVSLTFDDAATQRQLNSAIAQVGEVYTNYKRGAVLAPPGSVIDSDGVILAILREEYEAINSRLPMYDRIVRVATVVALLIVLGGIIAYHLAHHETQIVASIGQLTIYLATITVTIGVARFLSYDPWRADVIPLFCTVMVFAIAYNQTLAALTGFSMALVHTLAVGGGLDEFVVIVAVIATSVVQLSQVSSRSKLITVGVWMALAYALVSWGLSVISSQSLDQLLARGELLRHCLRGAGWCLVSGYLVAGSLPFIERTFGVITDISLLELGDVSHPLLQELVQRAPGTYNHSMGVASIAESAADAIGANGLLCRVGAYFHDVGKMLKPYYFVENMIQGQESRHEHLAPAMSTLVIIGHVKDGAELARQHGLPRPLIDFIEQHHGTTRVEFFYHAATRQAEQAGNRDGVEESSFRYPGPRPQTKEAGVLMIADAVEGASRTLSDPTPKRLESLVHEITLKRLLDGQFEECPLSLAELSRIEDSLTKSLIGIYHGRIKYPDQKTA